MPMCTKHGLQSHGLSMLAWKKLSGHHRGLTSSPLITFEMNTLVGEWTAIHIYMFQNLVESLIKMMRFLEQQRVN